MQVVQKSYSIPGIASLLPDELEHAVRMQDLDMLGRAARQLTDVPGNKRHLDMLLLMACNMYKRSNQSHDALGNFPLEVAKIAFNLGASVDFDFSTLEESMHKKEMLTCLHAACRHDNDALFDFLIENKAQVNIESLSGGSPLAEAMLHTDESYMDRLLENGADPNYGSTMPAWYYALDADNYRVLDYLFERGADVNCVSVSGGSALHYLTHTYFGGDDVYDETTEGIINILIKRGLDPFMKDPHGKTARDHASELRHDFLIELFSELEASHLENSTPAAPRASIIRRV